MKKLFILTMVTLASTILPAQHEVIYHVFQRSFFDSNNDGHGDLNGIHEKLDYLQELGVTSLLLTPLYQSEFYHNYFATDFEKIDPEYGSMNDYLELVKEIHRRKMKIYQDVEMQYVTHEHPWFTASYRQPASRFSNYVYYLDPLNQKPFWFYHIPEFTTYNNLKQKIAVVNMNHPGVRQYTSEVLGFWLDPDKDGVFDDGVDGFRLDHMMNDLDNFKMLTNLFTNFWAPVLTGLRKVNPSVVIIAEQANWFSFGKEYFRDAGVDRVFAFHLSWAIETLNKENLVRAADSTLANNPPGKNLIVFVENHDTRRVASVKNMTPEKLKVVASLNLLTGGVPLLYYGQELGMKGRQMKGATDGNDIPIREAFEWTRSGKGNGMALWYKDTGPWWDSTNIKANDGISFEEQKKDPGSLWNHYKKLIQLKKSDPSLAAGNYTTITNDNDRVFSFLRSKDSRQVLVVANLSDQKQSVIVTLGSRGKGISAKGLWKNETIISNDGNLKLQLLPYGIQVLRVN